MIDRRQFVTAALAAATGLRWHAADAATATADLDPRQSGRIRASRDDAAIRAASHYRWVRDGAFTVAISPHAPPVSTYATDARTVVGADPDYAQLVADALGRTLRLVPIAWADWPLGLTSGKYDAVISNVGVTEQRRRSTTSRPTGSGCMASTCATRARSRGSPNRRTSRACASSRGPGRARSASCSNGAGVMSRKERRQPSCSISTTMRRHASRCCRAARMPS